MKLLFRTALAASLVGSAAVQAHAQFPRAAVDPALRDTGAQIYATDCAQCHGDDIRGNAKGPDLMRSLVVLHDRREVLRGKELGPVLASGKAGHNFHYDEKQLADISQFLTASINGILRSGYNAEPSNLLSGDAQAGEAYFNGAGGCVKCHSPTGNFAGIGAKYRPAQLQQKILFPNYGLGVAKKVQLTVTQPSGKVYEGDLVRMDDFTVSLREKSGEYRSLNRTAGTKVTSVNPFDAHVELLDKYTDADIHNLLAYLVTLK